MVLKGGDFSVLNKSEVEIFFGDVSCVPSKFAYETRRPFFHRRGTRGMPAEKREGLARFERFCVLFYYRLWDSSACISLHFLSAVNQSGDNWQFIRKSTIFRVLPRNNMMSFTLDL